MSELDCEKLHDQETDLEKDGHESAEHVRAVPIHRRPDLLQSCADLVNSEWRRSPAARLHSLQKSSADFPVSLVLLRGRREAERLLGHARLSRVVGDGGALFVETVVVARAERGRGFGRTLMEETERYARRRGCRRLFLTTHDQQHFYAHLGYELSAPVQSAGALTTFVTMETLKGFCRTSHQISSNSTPPVSPPTALPPPSSLPSSPPPPAPSLPSPAPPPLPSSPPPPPAPSLPPALPPPSSLPSPPPPLPPPPLPSPHPLPSSPPPPPCLSLPPSKVLQSPSTPQVVQTLTETPPPPPPPPSLSPPLPSSPPPPLPPSLSPLPSSPPPPPPPSLSPLPSSPPPPLPPSLSPLPPPPPLPSSPPPPPCLSPPPSKVLQSPSSPQVVQTLSETPYRDARGLPVFWMSKDV